MARPLVSTPGWRIAFGSLVTIATIAAIVVLQHHGVGIPNPAVIYFCAVVFATYVGGWSSGLISAAITLAYAMVFFSDPGHLFQYRPNNLARVLVLFLATPLIVLLTGLLKAQAERALRREHEARTAIEQQNVALKTLRTALEKVDHGVILLDRELRAEFINPAFRKIWKLPDDKAEGNPAFVALMYHGRDSGAYDIPDADIDDYVAERIAQIKSGEEITRDLRLRSGEVYRFKCKALGDERRMLSYTKVTDLVRHADELDALRAALDQVDYGIVLLDRELRVTYINRAQRRLAVLPDVVADSKPLFADLVRLACTNGVWAIPDGAHEAYIAKRIATVQFGDTKPQDMRLPDNRIIRSQCTVLPDGGRMLSYYDVTATVRNAERLQQLATTDALTGLSNRRGFAALAEIEWARFQRHGRPLSLAMIDIDLFKSVNDRFGHDVGDVLLNHIAALCRSARRDNDIVARLGGEEFVLLLPETDLEQAFMAAERLRQNAMNTPLTIGGSNIAMTISIGVAEAQPGMAGVAELMKRADEALYEAKRGGRNRTMRADPDPARGPGAEPPPIKVAAGRTH